MPRVRIPSEDPESVRERDHAHLDADFFGETWGEVVPDGESLDDLLEAERVR